MREEVKSKAHKAAEDRVITALAGTDAREGTRETFRRKLRDGLLDDKVIELEVADTSNPMGMAIPGQPGMDQIANLGEIFGKMMQRTVKKRLTVAASYELLLGEEADKLLDPETVTREAVRAVEQNGIVFIDEIDKVAKRAEQGGGEVSREGVQRDMLPLIEGSTVNTKIGMIRTDHILFIASGAFHVSSPSDLIPELQGRLPIRVELEALSSDDFVRILTEPDAALTRQHIALLSTEGLEITFTDDAIRRIAEIAFEVNHRTENIGARRLQTVMEHLLEDLSFEAAEHSGRMPLDANFVEERLGELARDEDLSRYIL